MEKKEYLSTNKKTPSLNSYQIGENITEVLAEDIGVEMANLLVKSLQIKDKEECKELYKKMAKLWVPILIHFVKWVVENSENKPIKFAMRDGEAFALIYNILYPNDGDHKIWINRKVCAIKTEDTNYQQISRSDLLSDYIKQEKLNEDFIFVDAGCWGTIIKDLYMDEKLDFKGKPLFFYSHNPNIPSFLSDLGISENFGEILNDSLESLFPKKFKSIETFEIDKQGKIVPKLELNNDTMKYLHGIFTEELIKITNEYKNIEITLPNIENVISSFYQENKLSRQSIFSCILSKSTPGTVNKTVFLATWPKKLNWMKKKLCIVISD